VTPGHGSGRSESHGVAGRNGGVRRLSERWRQKAGHLKREVYALYFAVRDPRVAWYAKALAACVVAYAFSPIDLIPDPIPIFGYLDDLVLIPLGVLAVRALIPEAVLGDCREKAGQLSTKPRNWIAAGVIIAIWLVLAAAVLYWLLGWIWN
jgi:uncharacterized membrane protein YkvA (DUF1232 family)